MATTITSSSDISDKTKYTKFVDRYNKLMTNVENLGQQIGSEKAVSDFLDLAEKGKSEILLGLESERSQNKNFTLEINNAKQNTNQIDLQLSNLVDTTQEILSKLTLFQSSLGKDMNFTEYAESKLAQIQGILNTQFLNRYIFGGTNSNNPPVGDIVSNSNIIQEQISNNYYHGGSEQFSTTIGYNYNISYGPLADDVGFQNLIAGLHTAINADINNDSNLKTTAFEYISTALNDIIQLRAVLGNNSFSIENQGKIVLQSNIAIQKLVDKITVADTSELSILFAGATSTLIAYYKVMAKQLNFAEII